MLNLKCFNVLLFTVNSVCNCYVIKLVHVAPLLSINLLNLFMLLLFILLVRVLPGIAE